MLRKSLVAFLIAGAVGAAAGPASARVDVFVQVAPPPPRVEVVPAPRRGWVWVPGYWDWRGRRHVWVAGTWVRERPGYRYFEPHWVERDGRWWLRRGHWGRGDRDGDGVPDRFDRHPNDPWRR